MSSEEEAISLCKELQDVCAQGGFRLTKWINNSRAVLMSIPETERAKEVKSLDLEKDNLPVERALGIQWSVEEDDFKFEVNLKPQSLTRRGILSTFSCVYDPLGYFAPFIFNARHILQELYKLNCEWDNSIPEAHKKSWQEWLMGLKQMENFRIKQCIKPSNFGHVKSAQLHHFCEASEKG